jgi:hypothetical protein
VLPFRVFSRANPPRSTTANSFRFRSCVERPILHYFGANKSFGIRSCREGSRKSFRMRSMRSYKNTGGGGYLSTSAPRSASPVICATWRLYPLWSQSIAHTSCHHGGVPSPTPNPLCALRASAANPLLSYSCRLLGDRPGLGMARRRGAGVRGTPTARRSGGRRRVMDRRSKIKSGWSCFAFSINGRPSSRLVSSGSP